ncbi:polysaccharide biosynthesis/export family protein [Hymenobacter aerilatus]|uniref:Polysaccharide biosynthesis/export family protein n=1 Tax=Hymenobacter aerilatus TaxID=2932251 RepID=A0A8T9SYI3_9BACT|nr:polysaccharide biosynthesis/export family protein [Hymenobacter aerilatus]UOR05280.1 polysaccharide biosynthesis/export family protein [Hymenobacter aerilatus]
MQQLSTTRRHLFFWLLCLPFALLTLLSSCTTSRVRQQNTMFRLDGTMADTSKLRRAVNRAERNYIIQPNDYLAIRVYTNEGESIIDPNGELLFGSPTGGGVRQPAGTGRQATNRGGGVQNGGTEFLVQNDGLVRLPMVGDVKLSGYTLLEADSVLKGRYNEFYQQPFVTTQVSNNRIVILGAVGGSSGQIIPLVNDNMNLIEVLALAGGIDGGAVTGIGTNRVGRADNIRLIRGDLKNPRVQVIDLTSFAGMRQANLQVEPNDIIYVEPVRRPFFEAVGDIAPLFSIVSGLAGLATTIIYLSIALRNNN